MQKKRSWRISFCLIDKAGFPHTRTRILPRKIAMKIFHLYNVFKIRYHCLFQYDLHLHQLVQAKKLTSVKGKIERVRYISLTVVPCFALIFVISFWTIGLAAYHNIITQYLLWSVNKIYNTHPMGKMPEGTETFKRQKLAAQTHTIH